MCEKVPASQKMKRNEGVHASSFLNFYKLSISTSFIPSISEIV
jgi:hypothetical protein